MLSLEDLSNSRRNHHAVKAIDLHLMDVILATKPLNDMKHAFQRKNDENGSM